jgi:hypothetical protein
MMTKKVAKMNNRVLADRELLSLSLNGSEQEQARARNQIRELLGHLEQPRAMVVPEGSVTVPVEVLRLYEFMVASFTPYTSQHEQIAISLRKAKSAMLAAAPAPSHAPKLRGASDG